MKTCVVPLEPTEEMLNAARDWSYNLLGKPIGNSAAIGCYHAMLAAAPPQSEPADHLAAPDSREREKNAAATEGEPMDAGVATPTSAAAPPSLVWCDCALSRCQSKMKCEYPDACQSNNAAGQVDALRDNPDARAESPVPAAPPPTADQQIEYWFRRCTHAEQELAKTNAAATREIRPDKPEGSGPSPAAPERRQGQRRTKPKSTPCDFAKRLTIADRRKNGAETADALLQASQHIAMLERDYQKMGRRLQAALAQVAELEDARDMWKAEVRRTTDVQLAATREALQRAEKAEAELATANEQRIRDSIEVEKMLCDVLGRSWAASGFSIETLIRDIKAELAELRRGEFICKKCGIRKDGEGEHGDF